MNLIKSTKTLAFVFFICISHTVIKSQNAIWEPLQPEHIYDFGNKDIDNRLNLIVAPDDNPIICFLNDKNEVIVKKNNGSSWEQIGKAIDTIPIRNSILNIKMDITLSLIHI